MVDGSLNLSLCVSLSISYTQTAQNLSCSRFLKLISFLCLLPLQSTIFIFSLFIYLSLFSPPLAFYRSIFPILSLRRTLSFSPSLTLYLMRTPFSHAQFFVGFSPRNQSTRGLSSSCLSLSLSSCCRCCSFRHTFSILSGSRSDPRKMEKRIFYFQEIS